MRERGPSRPPFCTWSGSPPPLYPAHPGLWPSRPDLFLLAGAAFFGPHPGPGKGS